MLNMGSLEEVTPGYSGTHLRLWPLRPSLLPVPKVGLTTIVSQIAAERRQIQQWFVLAGYGNTIALRLCHCRPSWSKTWLVKKLNSKLMQNYHRFLRADLWTHWPSYTTSAHPHRGTRTPSPKFGGN